VESQITNDDNPWFYFGEGCGATNDRFFLLSIEEVVKYFGDSGQLENRPYGVRDTLDFESGQLLRLPAREITDGYNSERIAMNLGGEASRWWLRSPGYNNDYAAGVNPDGEIDVNGYYVHHFAGAGLRPASWLHL